MIVVVQHDVGWLFHVAIARESFTVGKDGDVQIEHELTTFTTRDMVEPVRIGEYTLTFERHDDPVESTLLEARGDDASQRVYADWLEHRGLTTHAAFVRGHLAILGCRWSSTEYSALTIELRRLEAALPYGWRSYMDRPTIELGDRMRLAFLIGLTRLDNLQDRTVQIWAAGVEMTVYDDRVYIPAFLHSLEAEIEVASECPPLRGDPVELHRHIAGAEGFEMHRFLTCGPTTDAFSASVFADGDEVVMGFSFRRRPEDVMVARMPRHELVELLETAHAVLKRGV